MVFIKIKTSTNWITLAEYFEQQAIAADIEEKLANHRDIIRGGISCIYFSLANKWKPCHGAINSRPRYLRMELEK